MESPRPRSFPRAVQLLLFSFNIISGIPQAVPDKMAKLVELNHDTAYDGREIILRSLGHVVWTPLVGTVMVLRCRTHRAYGFIPRLHHWLMGAET
jgi:hypothetical protein